MNDPQDQPNDKLADARRRLLESHAEPEPFWRTTVFQRAAGLMLLLVAVTALGIYLYWQRIQSAEREAQEAAVEAELGSPVPADPLVREQRRETMFEGALRDSENGDDFRETPGYYSLVRAVASLSPEQVHERATRWLDFEGALKDPDGWRGEFVRFRGLMNDVVTQRLEVSVVGIRDVYRGYVFDGEGAITDDRVVFDLITPPPQFRPRWDAWDIEGVFYRTVKYESKDGKTREYPWIIARVMRPAVDPASKLGILQSPVAAAALVIGLALIATRLLLLLAKKRRPVSRAAGPDIEQLFAQRRRAASSSAVNPSDPPRS